MSDQPDLSGQPDLPEPEHEEAIAVVVANLAKHFPDVAVGEIRDLVTAAVDRLAADTKAPTFVPVLAEREVRDALEARV